jgi:GH35 family endo-1,4-beta-xylanase
MTTPRLSVLVRRLGRAALIPLVCLSATIAGTIPLHAQDLNGYPDSLRSYSDHHKVGFRIGTAVVLRGGGGFNGYHPGILSDTPQDESYQAMVRDQFNQIEPENELKMQNVWTGGAERVDGQWVAKTNLFDPSGPLAQLCTWAEQTRPRMAVRGHVMVYQAGYTVPRFPDGEPPLFTGGGGGFGGFGRGPRPGGPGGVGLGGGAPRIGGGPPGGSPAGSRPPGAGGGFGAGGFGGGFGGFGAPMKLNPKYTSSDLRDMLQSYVRQVVDATMIQNATSRTRYHYRVVGMWDVTNEVINDDANAPDFPGAGFAYRRSDPWYTNGPSSAPGFGYDYVPDIYRWASDEMLQNVGKTMAGRTITDDDRFELYYNDYNLEWSADKFKGAMNLIQHTRAGGGEVDGLGFQGHIKASGSLSPQFETSIKTATAAGLRFALTELDCAINERPGPTDESVAQQEITQGANYGAVMALCVKYGKWCDCYQIWGASDDGSWLANQEATPITRWVADTRDGRTKGQEGYWPKEGQLDPATLYSFQNGGPDPSSARVVSNAYDQMVNALRQRRR